VSAFDLINRVQRLKALRTKLAAARPKGAAQAEDPRRSALAALPLLDFVPALSPALKRPKHLKPIVDALERTELEQVLLLVSTPPQHGKTFLVAHAIVRFLLRHPDRQVIYVSFGGRRAQKISKEIRKLAKEAGLVLSADSKAAGQWRTAEGGGLLAVGILGGITGEPGALVIIDDPHKNRQEAESSILRERVVDEVRASIVTRLHPKTSVIVVHTRWHPDDLIGTLSKDPILKDDRGDPLLRPDGRPQGWEVVNLPAVNDNDEPLWPEERPFEWLRTQKAILKSEYDWASLFMGQPRPRGAKCYRDVAFYERLPERRRYGVGADLACTEKTRADRSVALEGCVDPTVRGSPVYITDCVSRQIEAPEFRAILEGIRAKRPGAPFLAFIGGTEKGTVQLFNAPPRAGDKKRPRINLMGRVTNADKFQRAQPSAADWNEGLILLPLNKAALDPSLLGTEEGEESLEWVEDFLVVLHGFTGTKDKRDDEVDALGALHNVLSARRGGGGGSGSPLPILTEDHEAMSASA
jgi:hypothetical protein